MRAIIGVVNVITEKFFTKYYFLLDILHIYVILAHGEEIDSIANRG